MIGAILILMVIVLTNVMGAAILLVTGHIALAIGLEPWMTLVSAMFIAVAGAIGLLLWLSQRASRLVKHFTSSKVRDTGWPRGIGE